MNADTVIVGSSKTPGIKSCTARGYETDVDLQEKMEEELSMHYPEQETEVFPGNDVMVPVEEEGKEFHHPTTATEKWSPAEKVCEATATSSDTKPEPTLREVNPECLTRPENSRKAPKTFSLFHPANWEDHPDHWFTSNTFPCPPRIMLETNWNQSYRIQRTSGG